MTTPPPADPKPTERDVEEAKRTRRDCLHIIYHGPCDNCVAQAIAREREACEKIAQNTGNPFLQTIAEFTIREAFSKEIVRAIQARGIDDRIGTSVCRHGIATDQRCDDCWGAYTAFQLPAEEVNRTPKGSDCSTTRKDEPCT